MGKNSYGVLVLTTLLEKTDKSTEHEVASGMVCWEKIRVPDTGILPCHKPEVEPRKKHTRKIIARCYVCGKLIHEGQTYQYVGGRLYVTGKLNLLRAAPCRSLCAADDRAGSKRCIV